MTCPVLTDNVDKVVIYMLMLHYQTIARVKTRKMKKLTNFSNIIFMKFHVMEWNLNMKFLKLPKQLEFFFPFKW